MATPRSALISTSSSRSSMSSSSFRLVMTLGEIVRQRARGAGKPRAELIEPAALGSATAEALGFSFLRSPGGKSSGGVAPGAAAGPAGGGADLGDGADLPASSGEGCGCGPAGGGPFGLGVDLGLADASLGRRSRSGGSSRGGRSCGGSFLSGPLPGGSRLGGGGVSMGFGVSSPAPNSRLKKLDFLVSLMALPSRAARRRHRPRPRRRSARPLPCSASIRTGVKSAERPCRCILHQHLMRRPLALSRWRFSAATPFSRNSPARARDHAAMKLAACARPACPRAPKRETHAGR